MIIIKALQRSNTRQIRLEVHGHAGQAEYGQDIVCSAVSILVYTVAQFVKVLEADGRLASPPTVELQSGNAVINAVCRDGVTFDEALHMMFFAKTGFSLLQANHPEYIKFIVNEA